MGPKKKGKKKGGDKKKKVATDEAANAEPEIQMEEGTKQYYMTQLLSLQKKVAGYDLLLKISFISLSLSLSVNIVYNKNAILM
jgi:hypothetical protein